MATQIEVDGDNEQNRVNERKSGQESGLIQSPEPFFGEEGKNQSEKQDDCGKDKNRLCQRHLSLYFLCQFLLRFLCAIDMIIPVIMKQKLFPLLSAAPPILLSHENPEILLDIPGAPLKSVA